LNIRQGPTDRQPDEDRKSDQERLDALLGAKDEIIADLRSRVESLEHQLEARQEEIHRRDILLAQLVQRIPELEAPRDRAERPGPGDTPTKPPTPAEVLRRPQSRARRRKLESVLIQEAHAVFLRRWTSCLRGSTRWEYFCRLQPYPVPPAYTTS
jgi:hypothetical protein